MLSGMQIQNQTFTLEASVLLVIYCASKKLADRMRRSQRTPSPRGVTTGNSKKRQWSESNIIELTDDDED